MKPNISCKQAVDYISKKEEGRLSVSQRLSLLQHLFYCSLCRAFNKQNKLITHAAGRDHGEVHMLSEIEKAEIIVAVLEDGK